MREKDWKLSAHLRKIKLINALNAVNLGKYPSRCPRKGRKDICELIEKLTSCMDRNELAEQEIYVE